MAFTLLFGTGFEMGGGLTYMEDVTILGEGYNLAIEAGGIGGSYCLMQKTWGTPTFEYDLQTTVTELYGSFYLSAPAYSDRMVKFTLADNSTLSFRWRSDRTFDLYRNETLLAEGSVTSTGWHNWQFYIKIDDTTGRVILKLDGTSYLDYTGDTQGGSSSTITKFGLYKDASSNQFGYWDNIAIGSGDWPGDIRFEAIRPTSDYSVNWNKSEGTVNADLVNQIGVDDDTYVYTSSGSVDDLYNMADFDSTDKDLVGVINWARAKKSSTGSNTIAQLLRSNSTTYSGATKELTTAYKYFYEVYAKDPATDAEWTDSGIDDVISGIRSVDV